MYTVNRYLSSLGLIILYRAHTYDDDDDDEDDEWKIVSYIRRTITMIRDTHTGMCACTWTFCFDI